MGQGRYEEIGFGCVLPGTEHWIRDSLYTQSIRNRAATDGDREDANEEVPASTRLIEHLEWQVFDDEGKIAGVALQTPQEAEPYYLVIPLASTDPAAGRETRRRVVLPGMCALPLNDLIAFWIATIPDEVLADAQHEWEQVCMVAEKAGITLPSGQLIYLSDWD